MSILSLGDLLISIYYFYIVILILSLLAKFSLRKRVFVRAHPYLTNFLIPFISVLIFGFLLISSRLISDILFLIPLFLLTIILFPLLILYDYLAFHYFRKGILFFSVIILFIAFIFPKKSLSTRSLSDMPPLGLQEKRCKCIGLKKIQENQDEWCFGFTYSCKTNLRQIPLN